MDTKLIRKGILLSASVGSVAASAATQQEPMKMNVIYILADDLGFGDLGCTGSQHIKTPNIDRLAREGMFFTQHYAGSTVSAPSRSVLMTGQHTGHTPIRGNKEMATEGQLPLPEGTYTMARMFREAGYATGAFGKWGLGYPGSEGDPVYQGFDRFFGYNCQREAHRYYTTHLWDNLERVTLEENADGARGVYAPDLIQEQARKFIVDHRRQPFFLFLPYIQPHAELLVPEDEVIAGYRGRFEEHPYTAKPGGDYGEGMKTTEYCSQAEPHATFAAMVTRLDNYVGEIMKTLEETGLADRTLVVFSSDNGPHKEGGADPDYFRSYGPYRGLKRDIYEGGIHLPMIVWAPSMIAAGSTNDHLCASWDMLPTFAELAGAEIPSEAEIDGISLLPTLTGKGEQKEHEYLYWEFHERGGKIAVRMGRWKGVLQNVRRNPNARLELYDLSTDIHEDHDVAANHPQIVARMKEIMRKARTDSERFPFVNKAL